jgi:hypothetical protein
MVHSAPVLDPLRVCWRGRIRGAMQHWRLPAHSTAAEVRLSFAECRSRLTASQSINEYLDPDVRMWLWSSNKHDEDLVRRLSKSLLSGGAVAQAVDTPPSAKGGQTCARFTSHAICQPLERAASIARRPLARQSKVGLPHGHTCSSTSACDAIFVMSPYLRAERLEKHRERDAK